MFQIICKSKDGTGRVYWADEWVKDPKKVKVFKSREEAIRKHAAIKKVPDGFRTPIVVERKETHT